MKYFKFLGPAALGAVFGCASHHPTVDGGAAPAHFGGFDLAATLEPLPALKIEHYLHKKSGLNVFLVRQPQTQVVAYVTAYNVGARFELKGRTGIAHLFEHLMFRGTEHFPRPFETLSEWGERFNAYTASDLTLFHELVPKSLLADVTRFESERMRKLSITPEGFNTERGAVVSERKMRTEDSPFGRLEWELFQLAFDKHPYKTGPIGFQEDLDATTFDDALGFYNRFYAPNRAQIVIVGDFNFADVLGDLEKNYGGFTSSPWTEPQVPAEPKRTAFRRKVMPMKAESVYMADATFNRPYREAGAEVDSLLCSLLADSKMGYLVQALVEKKIARSVSADCSPNVDPGLSAVFVIGNPGVSVKKLESAYTRAGKGFLRWLTPERIESAKLYYLADQWESLRDPMNLAEQIARLSVTAGDPLYSFTYLGKIQKLGRGDLEKRFNEWKIGGTRLILEPSKTTQPIKKGKS